MRDSADSATLVGRGKLDEIRAEANAHPAPLICSTTTFLSAAAEYWELTERR